MFSKRLIWSEVTGKLQKEMGKPIKVAGKFTKETDKPVKEKGKPTKISK
ncbi:hypothetical protein ACFYKT_08840 [Cytobacillus sp. FJAT-53684]|uniref:CsbD family protein n=1 Tax=Cytobacillus mangrovibacter TaxID=3299024 RepID=A0ABW6JYK7_9BACI